MTVTVKDAQADLLGLIRQLAVGETLTLTDNDVTVATVVPAPAPRPLRKLGTMKGSVLYMAPDFDETPEEFREYMA